MKDNLRRDESHPTVGFIYRLNFNLNDTHSDSPHFPVFHTYIWPSLRIQVPKGCPKQVEYSVTSHNTALTATNAALVTTTRHHDDNYTPTVTIVYNHLNYTTPHNDDVYRVQGMFTSCLHSKYYWPPFQNDKEKFFPPWSHTSLHERWSATSQRAGVQRTLAFFIYFLSTTTDYHFRMTRRVCSSSCSEQEPRRGGHTHPLSFAMSPCFSSEGGLCGG